MAVTVKDIEAGAGFSLRFKVFDITFDGSYTTGGLLLTPAMLGFSRIIYVDVASGAGTGIVAAYDYANQKIKSFWSNASGSKLGEVVPGTNLSGDSVRILVIGA
jgi:hypothetical protein